MILLESCQLAFLYNRGITWADGGVANHRMESCVHAWSGSPRKWLFWTTRSTFPISILPVLIFLYAAAVAVEHNFWVYPKQSELGLIGLPLFHEGRGEQSPNALAHSIITTTSRANLCSWLMLQSQVQISSITHVFILRKRASNIHAENCHFHKSACLG